MKKTIFKKKKFLILASFLVVFSMITAITLSSCSGSIEGLNQNTIVNLLFPNLWVFVGQLISMLILFLVILFFIWKPTNKMLERRKALILSEINEANEYKEQAKIELEEAQALNESIKAKADDMIKEAELRSEQIIREAQIEATHEAEKILTAADDEVKHEMSKIKYEAELEIISTAFKAAEALMKKEINKKDNEKLVKDFINSLEQENE